MPRSGSGGTISVIGLIAGRAANINTYEFVTKNVTVHGIETGSQQMYAELAAFLDRHHLVPMLDSVHPVEKIQDALHHLERGTHFGKIVIALARPDGDPDAVTSGPEAVRQPMLPTLAATGTPSSVR